MSFLLNLHVCIKASSVMAASCRFYIRVTCDKFDMLMTGESVLMSNMTIENDAYTTESVTASNTVVGVVIGVVSTVAIIIVGLVVIFLIRYCRTTSSCSF